MSDHIVSYWTQFRRDTLLNSVQARQKMNYASYKILFKELKNGIEILVGQAVFKL